MSREMLLIVIGVMVYVTPFLGVPSVWKDMLQFGCGILIVLVGITYRISRRRSARTERDTFHIEHDPRIPTGEPHIAES